MTYISSTTTPIGRLIFEAGDEALTSITIGTGVIEERPNAVIMEAIRQVQAYFKGSTTTFDLPLDFGDATPFQVKVWKELMNIPFGTTISYLQLAQKVGTEKHTRAVGLANGKNPLPIVVPCHRVIGSDRSLTGYALGLKTKLFLLNHETPGAFVVQASLF
ncbi:MAG TPA: methylated-DNA--[protein]-cysteine S-methyltransferase [Saprospiraceae bacterium]|nr:methylated-DNA--[protein]-cysteine S-methyltransferase [Saprospiraceae bacterium]